MTQSRITDITDTYDELASSVTLEEALEIAEELRDYFSIAVDALRDDLKKEEDAE